MRTTLTIDDDIAVLIEQEQRRSGHSLKRTVNTLLRRGLSSHSNPEPRKKFVVTPIAMNTGLGTRYQTVEDLIEALEGPMHR